MSFMLTSVCLNYVTPVRIRSLSICPNVHCAIQGKSKSAMEILKRIDYAGSFTLMGSV